MKWLIEKNLVCPSTGVCFALLSGLKNLRMVLFYQGDYFLREGSMLRTSEFGLVINGMIRKIKIIHFLPFNHSLWHTLEDKLGCPGNKAPLLNECDKKTKCVFKLCPYGAL